jgi:hypothetical protein
MAIKTVQVNQVLRLTIAQAAEAMGLSRRQARRRLHELHQAHQSAGILHRLPGARGWEVSPRGLGLVLSGELEARAEEVAQRVTFLESDMRSVQYRIGRLEDSTNPQKTSRRSITIG